MGTISLDLLRFDLTNCRYPVNYCRMGPTLLGFLDDTHDEGYQYPKRIDIVGIETNWSSRLMGICSLKAVKYL